jgi:glycosyltransferase involved in cell wall biosynthesis
MKFAFFGIPHTGGTHTVYKSLRAGLLSHGIEVIWLGLGPEAKTVLCDPQWASYRETGVVVAGECKDAKQQAVELLRFFEEKSIDGLFVNAACDRVQSNIPRYLDPTIPRLMIVHTISIGAYRGARAIRDHVHATICVSPRIRKDLINKYGFKVKRTHMVPNAINLNPFLQSKRNMNRNKMLRLLFLGRIVDSDKGVFWLPEIMRRIAHENIKLTIAGDGPDFLELRKRCDGLEKFVDFIGRVDPDYVPKLLAEHDIFLFPSRFEGLPLSLLEAEAAGCVPVASRIKGVTDFVINDSEDGLLFKIGDVRAAANAILSFVRNHDRLLSYSIAARQNIAGRFDIANMANEYFKILSTVLEDMPSIRPSLPISKWNFPLGLRPGLRTFLPTKVKNWLRLLRERLA